MQARHDSIPGGECVWDNGERESFTTLSCDDVMEAKAPMKTIYKENMELFLAKVRI